MFPESTHGSACGDNLLNPAHVSFILSSGPLFLTLTRHRDPLMLRPTRTAYFSPWLGVPITCFDTP